MRLFAVLAAALLLSSCAWVRHEIVPTQAPPPAATPATPAAKPDPARPHRPHIPAATTQSMMATPVTTPATPPAPDYSARCHAMADNRAADARQLGASAADQTKMQADTYRDCMAQSKP
ncbi:MAG TPA: hypothetical protein VHZ78_16410 [Rhizomicrobium sp.]|jgi:hypothetical protein|nr:hypothetical protein [Rhizomicrobium sp.]